MVSVEPVCVLGSKDGLLIVGSDCRQSRQRLGEPRKYGRLGDSVQALEFTRGREVISNEKDRRRTKDESNDLHSHTIVEPRQRDDGEEEGRETEADDQ